MCKPSLVFNYWAQFFIFIFLFSMSCVSHFEPVDLFLNDFRIPKIYFIFFSGYVNKYSYVTKIQQWVLMDFDYPNFIHQPLSQTLTDLPAKLVSLGRSKTTIPLSICPLSGEEFSLVGAWHSWKHLYSFSSAGETLPLLRSKKRGLNFFSADFPSKGLLYVTTGVKPFVVTALVSWELRCALSNQGPSLRSLRSAKKIFNSVEEQSSHLPPSPVQSQWLTVRDLHHKEKE